MINSLLFHLCAFLSLLVGAELLSILDETENGFVWEHIQSYAEQAHGAWLGISVKGPETLHQTVRLSSSKLINLHIFQSFFVFFNPSLFILGCF